MNGQFVVSIDHLECQGHLSHGIEIAPGLRITDDPRRVKCLGDDAFVLFAGQLEADCLTNSKFLFYTELIEFPSSDGPAQIALLLNVVNNFLSFLWLLKEHTAFFDRGYLFESNRNLHSNTLLCACYDSNGKRRPVKVSRSELDNAKLILRSYTKDIAPDYSIDQERTIYQGSETLAHKDIDLVGRFLAFVHLARQTIDPALRIAFACSALEVLFSTGTSELTHRVSERVAFLLGSNGPERLSIYNKVKRLYGIRSAFLHGDSIKKADQPSLRQRTREADVLLRDVAAKIAMDPVFAKAVRTGKDELELYHSQLLFR